MFVQYISEYLEALDIERGLSQNTIDAYRRDLASFADFLLSQGVEDFCQIKRTHINYYIKQLHYDKYTATSVTRKIAAIRGWFKWLLANEIIKQDPSLSIELPKLSKRLPKVVSVPDIEKMLSNHLNSIETKILHQIKKFFHFKFFNIYLRSIKRIHTLYYYK